MPKYSKVAVTEQQLEHLVSNHADVIEDGLAHVDHQRPIGGGRLDVLFVDSGKALVIAELKVVEDDGMLAQAIDYYDQVCVQVETFARLHKGKGIDPTQPVRLFLIAPRFSQALVNRCKWLDIQISLFTYTCLKIEGSDDLTLVFNEQTIPSRLKKIEVYQLEDILSYITDAEVQERVRSFLAEVRGWKQGQITTDAVKQAVSMKVGGKVFAYLLPRRKHFVISTYDNEDDWEDYPIHQEADLDKASSLAKGAMERRAK